MALANQRYVPRPDPGLPPAPPPAQDAHLRGSLDTPSKGHQGAIDIHSRPRTAMPGPEPGPQPQSGGNIAGFGGGKAGPGPVRQPKMKRRSGPVRAI